MSDDGLNPQRATMLGWIRAQTDKPGLQELGLKFEVSSTAKDGYRALLDIAPHLHDAPIEVLEAWRLLGNAKFDYICGKHP